MQTLTKTATGSKIAMATALLFLANALAFAAVPELTGTQLAITSAAIEKSVVIANGNDRQTVRAVVNTPNVSDIASVDLIINNPPGTQCPSNARGHFMWNAAQGWYSNRATWWCPPGEYYFGANHVNLVGGTAQPDGNGNTVFSVTWTVNPSSGSVPVDDIRLIVTDNTGRQLTLAGDYGRIGRFDTVAPVPYDVSGRGATPSIGISDARRIAPRPAMDEPPYNTPSIDPVFGTTLRRITDRVQTGPNGYANHIYSQLQAFSPYNQYVLLQEDGDYRVRHVDTLERMTDQGLLNTNDPRWQPALPSTVVHYDSNEDIVLRAQYTNIMSGQTETMFTFPAGYQTIRNNQSFGGLSRDGRWMAGMASMANGDHTIFSLDMASWQLAAQVSLNALYNGICAPDPQDGVLDPDWVGVSPLGKYLVVQWARDGLTRCSGLEAWDITTGRYLGHVVGGHDHGDLGVESDGQREFFMTFGNQHPDDNSRLGIVISYLPGSADGPINERYIQMANRDSVHHISCQGPNGVCLVTAFRHNEGNPWGPLDEELYLQYTDGRMLRLTHHRSSDCGYWVEPRASMSRDGRYIIFDSDWGVNRCASSNENLGRGEVYTIEMPAGLIARGPAQNTVTASSPSSPLPESHPSLPPVSRPSSSSTSSVEKR